VEKGRMISPAQCACGGPVEIQTLGRWLANIMGEVMQQHETGH